MTSAANVLESVYEDVRTLGAAFAAPSSYPPLVTALGLQSFHMILGQLPLRAKPSHVEAEPGGSRGTVVIVRTRVGFGVSLVGDGARVQVFERSICAQNGHFWRLLRYP